MITIFTLSCSNSTTTPQDESLKLQFNPVTYTVPIYNPADFSIMVVNVENLFAFSAEIVFDSSVAELDPDTIVPGGFWGTDIVELSVIESGRLNISISLQQTANEDGISGNGTLLNISLEGINPGTTNITFENLQMIDENGDDVTGFDTIEIINGNLIVE